MPHCGLILLKVPLVRLLAYRALMRTATLMRINIWIVLAVLLALLAITRLSQYQHETQRICADDPSALVCGR